MDTTAYDACMSAVPFDAVAPSDFLVRLQPGDENVIGDRAGEEWFYRDMGVHEELRHSPWSRQW
jgi:hypothetical protein